MPQRTSICICFFLLLCNSFQARANTPIIDGLAGAGRSGIPEESVFLNPAAIGLVQAPIVFYDYSKPKISDWNAGGRDFTLGLYDTTNPYVHSGFAFERQARARLVGNSQAYSDSSTIRFGVARQIVDTLYAGITPRYVIQHGSSTKYISGDAGIIFNLFGDMRAGLTYENFARKPEERPRTLAGGLHYGIGFGVSAYGDYGAAMADTQKGKKLWSLGTELSIIDDFVLRGGLYRDAIVSQRGSAWGIGWVGPRASFDFSMHLTAHAPVQRDMTAGITVKM